MLECLSNRRGCQDLRKGMHHHRYRFGRDPRRYHRNCYGEVLGARGPCTSLPSKEMMALWQRHKMMALWQRRKLLAMRRQRRNSLRGPLALRFTEFHSKLVL